MTLGLGRVDVKADGIDGSSLSGVIDRRIVGGQRFKTLISHKGHDFQFVRDCAQLWAKCKTLSDPKGMPFCEQ
jgi:hypothetical protein